MTQFYLIRSTFKGVEFVYETNLVSRTLCDVVEEIAAGQFDTGPIVSIHLIDLGAGAGPPVDMTGEIASLLGERSFRRGPLPRVAEELVERLGLLILKDTVDDSLVTDTIKRFPIRTPDRIAA